MIFVILDLIAFVAGWIVFIIFTIKLKKFEKQNLNLLKNLETHDKLEKGKFLGAGLIIATVVLIGIMTGIIGLNSLSIKNEIFTLEAEYQSILADYEEVKTTTQYINDLSVRVYNYNSNVNKLQHMLTSPWTNWFMTHQDKINALNLITVINGEIIS